MEYAPKIRIFVYLAVFLFYASFTNCEFQKVSSSPEVYVCDHFLSDEECDHLIAIAKPFLKRATVADTSTAKSLIDSRRTSLGTFISSFTKDKIVRGLQKNIAYATEIPEENGEDMQVLYYGLGAEYRPHYDYFDPSTVGGLSHYKRGGQRTATFIVYLNTPIKGGATVFPLVNVSVVPKKGKALLFYNTTSKGDPDPMSFHGGAPVIEGEKWIITRWLREKKFN